MDICSSPKLFAAYHVFHRLLVPRHPPCALIRLTNFLCHVASRQLVWVFIKFMFSQDLPKQFSEDHYVLWLPLGNLLGCLSLKYLRKNFLFCMRFSRYILILEHILLWSVNNSSSETHQVFSVSHYSAAWALGKQVFLVQDILRISCLVCLTCFIQASLEKLLSQPNGCSLNY